MERGNVPAPAPTEIDARAADDLHFIRQAMARSTIFTAVPGRGGVMMGIIGLVAAVLAAAQPSPARWLAVWLLAAGAASRVGIVAIRHKARRAGEPLTGMSGRRFAAGLAAPIAAGALMTMGLLQARGWDLMPATWLLLYGAAVITGGAFSVPAVRFLGVAFMVFGATALITPAEWGNAWLAAGFGGLQILFGLYIGRRHGG